MSATIRLPSPAPEAVSLQSGLACQRGGDLAGAAAIYGAILAKSPSDSMATNLLGLTLCESGRFDDGMALIRRAITLADQAFYHLSLGQALAGRGRLAEALPEFHRGIALEPNVAATHVALGTALLGLGQFAAAAQAFARALALDPNNADSHLGHGLVLHQTGRTREALGPLQSALRLAPGRQDAWSALARALLVLGEYDAADLAAVQAVALAPSLAAAHCDLGDVRHARGAHAAAADCYRAAIALQPDLAVAYCHLSNALYDLRQFEHAAAAATAALAIAPADAAALCNLGNALQPLLRFAEAEAAYRQAVRLQPDSAAFHSNLGVVLTAQGRLDEALAAQRRALALAPEFIDANYNHAITLLMAGAYDAGWRQYEWRWRLPWSPPRGFAQPMWAGEDLAGRTILLHPEQGLGDTLQMVRYAPLVAARGGRVILEVQAPLVRLMRALAGPAEVVALGDPLPPFDVHCPLFSLPRVFATTLATVPATPYLAADPALAPAWSAKLGPRTGPRVGLVWAGAERIGRHVNRERSIALAQFAVLTGIAGLRFYSLQKGEAAADLRAAPDGLDVIDLMADVADFADTAALVAQLDLVISVDTSTAHLAAAMGKPVWLLSRYNGCWRWLSGRQDSPWYPGLVVHRQSEPGAWGPVFARLRDDLVEWSRAAGTAAG